MRAMRLPVRSVTQSMLSGPQVSSQGPASPETTTVLRNCLVPRRTEPGPSCASAGSNRDIVRIMARAGNFIEDILQDILPECQYPQYPRLATGGPFSYDP